MSDSVQQAILERYQKGVDHRLNLNRVAYSQSEDKSHAEELDDFEDDEILSEYREKRLEEFKRQMMARDSMKKGDYGEYTEVSQEKEILTVTTNTKRVVCHFFHKDFRRCDIVDKHLKALSTTHVHTRFIKINVDNAPFLVEKLAVRMLPCIIAFIDGHAVDRVVGFDELGGSDSFQTPVLERRLGNSGVITVRGTKITVADTSIFGSSKGRDDDSDDDD